MNKIKILSLFSGIGAFEKALEKLKIDYELVNYCEIDKYASKAYSLIHNCNENKNLGDITKIDTCILPKDIDLITYGFPCQDISLAGKQKGFLNEDGTKTRSGLFFEALRIIEETKPKYAIAENVKNLVSNKFEKEFEIVLQSLKDAGYDNYFQVLNAKDYNIPQNRERVFIISVRKDIYNGVFEFPKKLKLKLKLKDLLEDNVDEKYYLNEKNDKCFTNMSNKNGFVRGNKFRPLSLEAEYGFTITTRVGERATDNFILIPEATKQGYAEAHEGDGVYLDRPYQKRGVVQKNMIQTLKCSGNDVGVVVKTNYNDLRIRKLTPKEYWRLMGFEDNDIDVCIENNISNAQLYKMAGNSIVVNVLMAIFENLFIKRTFSKKERVEQLTLF